MIKPLNNTIINQMYNGITIKEYLKSKLKYSNRIITNIKNCDGIKVNSIGQKINYVLKTDDILELSINDEVSEEIVPEEIMLDIIYEDEEILLINKPPNLVVHPTTYHFTGTLANGVMHYYKTKGISTKFRPVNRLDRDTSGLVLIAKTQLSHSILSKQLIDKTFKKEYLTIVHNKFENLKGVINNPIGRKPNSIIERMVDPNGQEAITVYNVVSQNGDSAFVRVNLLTGRTHQIRVHFNYINHPLYGDSLYGIENDFINRQALHCFRLKFVHPTNDEQMSFECCLPKDFEDLINKLGLKKIPRKI